MFNFTSFIRRLSLCALTCALGLGIAAVVFLLGQPPRAALAVGKPLLQVNVPAETRAPDGLSPTPDWVATGEAISDSFGSSVATAGDINGDGYSDAIVGAFRALSYSGQVYVYMGTANGLSASPALTLTGTNLELLGKAVATAGDVNGDGYADVLIGANGYMTTTGRVYLYTGSPAGLNPTPFFTATGETTNSGFGYAVATAGDVNADGYSDIIVGAPVYSTLMGRVYIYYGAPSIMSATPAFTATGETVYIGFGGSVGTTGDINGDGYADIVIGASGYDGSTGRAYVYYSSANGLSPTPNFTATGVTVSNLGLAVGTAGDVNGDGYADVLIGAPIYTAMQYGVVQIYTGSVNGLSDSPAFTVTTPFTNVAYGYSTSTAGDVNGDGYADILVGGYGYMTGTGYAHVYPGSTNGVDSTPAFTVTGEISFSEFGRAVNPAGDVNGDGYADIIIGAPYYMSSTGRAYVYHGGPDAPSSAPAWTTTNPLFGYGGTVGKGGDINGDGFTDVLVGAASYLSSTGLIHIYPGDSTGLSLTPVVTLTGEETLDNFSASAATAGDVNGDGYDDVIVGAYNYGNPPYQIGRVYVYHGSPLGLNLTPALTLTGDYPNVGGYGSVVSPVGDVNRDGFADVAVQGYIPNAIGRVYIYHGSISGLSPTPALTLTGSIPFKELGDSLNTAGDVNRDGYSDVIMAAHNGIGYQYQVTVHLGSSTGLSPTPIFTTIVPNRGKYLGSDGVGTAGDVNGDGYADIVIGADLALSETGQAYIYYGSPDGVTATPAFTATGEILGDQFGVAVGNAGDVNGDGYADMFVGATVRPYIYVYAGGPTGLNPTPFLTFTGDTGSVFFGDFVEGAGDVNSDGYADLIVGVRVSQTVMLFAGNSSYGLPLLPQQRRADNSAPIAHHGQSDSDDSFRLAALGRTPFGRGLVKLEWEVKSLGVLFDGAGLEQSATWLDTGTAGVALNELVTGLSANTQYHWRVRLRYHPASTPFQQYSRWVTQPWNGWQEADLRTAPSSTPMQLLYLPLLRR